MSRFPDCLLAAAAILAVSVAPALAAGDPVEGEKVFRRCSACHTVGEGAQSRVGPHLNDVFGRVAGTLDGFRFSAAMVAAGEGGLTWDEQTITLFLVKPRDVVKGTRMAFAGLRKSADVANVIAYLRTFDPDAPAEATDEAGAGGTQVARAEPGQPAVDPALLSTGPMRLGRKATEAEIAAWDIDVRPDGLGLPKGSGNVTDGEVLYTDHCAVCHGDFGEAVGRWPVLAGGQGSLADDRPVKTVGSYWPYLSTVYDYVRRAMPFGNARALSDDDVYAITAYLLYLNDVVEDEDFELSDSNFNDMRLENESNFIPDERASEPHYADAAEPCMSDCKPGTAEVTMRARVLDVTPTGSDEDESAGAGAID